MLMLIVVQSSIRAARQNKPFFFDFETVAGSHHVHIGISRGVWGRVPTEKTHTTVHTENVSYLHGCRSLDRPMIVEKPYVLSLNFFAVHGDSLQSADRRSVINDQWLDSIDVARKIISDILLTAPLIFTEAVKSPKFCLDFRSQWHLK